MVRAAAANSSGGGGHGSGSERNFVRVEDFTNILMHK